jgi:hypothetical protein
VCQVHDPSGPLDQRFGELGGPIARLNGSVDSTSLILYATYYFLHVIAAAKIPANLSLMIHGANANRILVVVQADENRYLASHARCSFT